MISFISPVARVCMNAMVSEDRSQDISIALSVGYIEGAGSDRDIPAGDYVNFTNGPGHELAVQLVGGLQGLSNVRIAWLPTNTTSEWQLIDQGIIASFKL
jgi:hypothetical protein